MLVHFSKLHIANACNLLYNNSYNSSLLKDSEGVLQEPEGALVLLEGVQHECNVAVAGGHLRVVLSTHHLQQVQIESGWNLRIMDTLGPGILSSIERLSSLLKLKCTSTVERRDLKSVSFMERVFFIQEFPLLEVLL